MSQLISTNAGIGNIGNSNNGNKSGYNEHIGILLSDHENYFYLRELSASSQSLSGRLSYSLKVPVDYVNVLNHQTNLAELKKLELTAGFNAIRDAFNPFGPLIHDDNEVQPKFSEFPINTADLRLLGKINVQTESGMENMNFYAGRLFPKPKSDYGFAKYTPRELSRLSLLSNWRLDPALSQVISLYNSQSNTNLQLFR